MKLILIGIRLNSLHLCIFGCSSILFAFMAIAVNIVIGRMSRSWRTGTSFTNWYQTVCIMVALKVLVPVSVTGTRQFAS